MVSIISLWLPILLSAIVVFIISSVLHMVITYHNNDFKKIPSEDQVMNDLGKYDIPPGNYAMPFTSDNKERKSSEFQEKMKRGPVAFVTVLPKGQINMGSSLAMWFVYSIIVSVLAAYITGRALPPGAHYLAVFRFVGATSFIGYSIALMQNSIWYGRSWGTTIKSMLDGLIYSLFTAGVFGWLWPIM